ncbi:2-amino-4-hydroxy-6-hydroxymethyldihydropteridine diphosphokinase [Alkalilimnicola ehrlichii]|uniref:2-amino-4-hydroxy-6-hydroxymethyldihydropteridine pyrophosphokinase n=1 Tax=Alkalilimnicola ehrlichii TaxID=351052 RepID=A0A3E0X1M1_9GAMM|nr:2-amino-4-hydroxy-6-hydroxymethyldihydropteridine diphosphokinase [Alkalilimnicola ehrlichii]RFA30604.1 2-amino-4-hydroxy-6-hydroxymethyldihydropteridine diphosphokinase [Alkalilimnicola ehrlichii]RFA38155.1 2-amino-4-hydroxy-6-hydroxymethyldihydropteridine diphosphokinase [Alkalilimnicola ehrlichii]
MANGSVTVAVGLGSNLAEPRKQVLQAVAALHEIAATELDAVSSLYRTRPMGPQDQPDFVNAAAIMRTRLQPLEFLDALQAIERRQGRVRGDLRWGARTLDLDLLLWGEEEISCSRLQVPHPGLHERAFVLYPLAEIGAGLMVPGRGTVLSLKSACPADGLVGMDPTPEVSARTYE